MISYIYRTNFQSSDRRSIFVSERVITVSKPKDQQDLVQKNHQRFNRTERIKREKVQESTENQEDSPEKPNRKKSPDLKENQGKKVQINEKLLRPTKEIEPPIAPL